MLESGADVGGTWYWNRYPGARCDVESLEYSYQCDEDLQQDWKWTERYATQPEILRYVNHVVERFDLRRDMRFGTRAVAAAFDEAIARWTVTTDGGTQFSARFLVMATGCLSSANLPNIAGRDSFGGASYHTGQWPHTPVDFTGQRVAVVGTGSSAIQSIPLIVRQAAGLYVFQRTASCSVPANNAPLDAAQEASVRADYAGFRARNAQMLAAFGARYPRNDASALAAGDAQREQQFERRWRIGGLHFMGSFNLETAVGRARLGRAGARQRRCFTLRSGARSVVGLAGRSQARGLPSSRCPGVRGHTWSRSAQPCQRTPAQPIRARPTAVSR